MLVFKEFTIDLREKRNEYIHLLFTTVAFRPSNLLTRLENKNGQNRNNRIPDGEADQNYPAFIPMTAGAFEFRIYNNFQTAVC